MLGLRDSGLLLMGYFCPIPQPKGQGSWGLSNSAALSRMWEARWALGTSPSEQREACAASGVGQIVLRLTEGRTEAGAAKGVLLIQSGPCLQQYLVQGSSQPPQFVRKIRKLDNS